MRRRAIAIQREALQRRKPTRPTVVENSIEEELWDEYENVLDEVDQLKGILREIERDLGI